MNILHNRKMILIFFLLIGLVLIVVSYFSGFFIYNNILLCVIPPPPTVMVDGAAQAKIYSWVDQNENGLVDPGESALPDVKIVHPYSSSIPATDQLGKAETYDFKPGCVCNCWKDGYVELIAPDGYRPTTPLRRELEGDGFLYQFGFVKLNR